MKRLTEEERAQRKVERAAYQKAYREQNRERRKQYTEINKEKIKQQTAQWAERNAEERRQYNKEWLIANAEHRAEYRKQNAERTKQLNDAYNATEKARNARQTYKRVHAEKIRKADFIYRAKPESKLKARTRKHKRRATERTGKLSPNIINKLLRLQKAKCAVCRCDLSNVQFHLDHIDPLATGGANKDSNVQLLCVPCNLSKGAKHPVDFMQSRGFLC